MYTLAILTTWPDRLILGSVLLLAVTFALCLIFAGRAMRDDP